MSEPAREFDIAVSFAGEDRDLVDEVVAGLKAAGLRVFYDSDFAVEMWGAELTEVFDDIYRNKSAFTIMFISRHYGDKMWPRAERRSALARGLTQPTPYVLPVRLDDTELDGLRPTVGYLDARRLGIDGIVAAAKAKVTGQAAPSPSITRVPRNEVELQQLLADPPVGWEYYHLAAELLRGRESAEPQFLDHEVHFAPHDGEVVGRKDIFAYVRRMTDDAQATMSTLSSLLEPEVQARALGGPGQPGDPTRINHLADRITSCYTALLKWAAQIRGASKPSELATILELLAEMVDQPVMDYRTFVDVMVSELDGARAAIDAGEPVELHLQLVLSIPDEHVARLTDEMQRLAAVE